MPTKRRTPWLSSKIEHAFTSSRELWVENPEFNRTVANSLSKKLGIDTDISLSTQLGEADAARLHSALARAGIAPDAFDNQLPWLAYLSITNVTDELAGVHSSAIPERTLVDRAQRMGKPVHTEWESTEAGIRYLAELPPPVQFQLARRALDDLENVSNIERRFSAWLEGDLSIEMELDEKWKRSYSELYARIVVKRNQAWALRIQQMFASTGTYFVCVGIGHLVGSDSIQQQLKLVGFDANRA